MPELPEVKTVCKYLNQKVLNKTILETKLYVPKSLHDAKEDQLALLKGEKIIEISQIAKYVVIKTTSFYLVIHLRMEGKFAILDNPSKIDHKILSLKFSDGNYLILKDHRKFATINLYPNNLNLREQGLFKNVGYEPKDINFDDLYKQIQKKRVPIKTFLLDQKYIAGIGNIYADEILYASKIHPLRLTANVSRKEAQEILDNSIKILDEATKLGGSTIKTFSALGFSGLYQEKLIVHQNVTSVCKNCGAIIEKIKVKGRGTYYCPREQK